MRFELCFLTRLSDDEVRTRRTLKEATGRRLRVGRAPENEIPLKDLRVAAHEADINVRDDDAVIEAVEGHTLLVDGFETTRAALTADNDVRVGPYRVGLTMPESPQADVAITVELVEFEDSHARPTILDPGRIRIGQGLLSRRTLSWSLFALVALIAFALPFLSYLWKPSPLTPLSAEAPMQAPAQPVLASLDTFWSSGDLSSSHKFLEKNCEACHVKAFVRVEDQMCTICHKDIRHHFDVSIPGHEALAPGRCATCHREHQGRDGVVPVQQQLCADCHKDLKEKLPGTTLINASDFEGDGHPQFRPSVTVDPATCAAERISIGAPNFPREKSNLIGFSHEQHLDQANIKDMVGRLAGKAFPAGATSLQCADCHKPDAGGVGMTPVSMLANCQSCHVLTFDQRDPQRVLPHGQPHEVIAALSDYYTARSLRQPAPSERLANNDPRRRAGSQQSEKTPIDLGRPVQNEIQTALQRVFADPKGTCALCHVTVPPDPAAKTDWQVLPVRLRAAWMPKGKFDHGAHRTTACETCHAAPTSRSPEDVLMPGVETCQACHGGQEASAKVPSTCIMCHDYHLEGMPRMAVAAIQGVDHASLPLACGVD
ncbi:MAG TPA: hypothetical protein VHL31_08900 [Geminicoccus sp.]|jgi:predicted CXXCH cytochrome family protein|uniref:hypothetical protein n=1 Tax=Geminicoccus sp. TaxID=2024832 RepID=UPI002E36BD25|nr:hypothetical protein [Geminicoccus sp.]HEX2526405.1 hypothetical protein [Geminicoccus sp.]